MKRYLKQYKWNIMLGVALLIGAIVGAFDSTVAGAAVVGLPFMPALTTTGMLGNGTKVYIAAGSPTAFLEIGNVRDVTFMDGSSAEVDMTNLSSTWKEKKLGLPDGGVVSFNVDTNFADVGQASALAAKNAQLLCTFKVTLPGGTTPNCTFDGYVRKFNVSTGVDSPAKSSIEFLVTGPVVLS